MRICIVIATKDMGGSLPRLEGRGRATLLSRGQSGPRDRAPQVVPEARLSQAGLGPFGLRSLPRQSACTVSKPAKPFLETRGTRLILCARIVPPKLCIPIAHNRPTVLEAIKDNALPGAQVRVLDSSCARKERVGNVRKQ